MLLCLLLTGVCGRSLGKNGVHPRAGSIADNLVRLSWEVFTGLGGGLVATLGLAGLAVVGPENNIGCGATDAGARGGAGSNQRSQSASESALAGFLVH